MSTVRIMLKVDMGFCTAGLQRQFAVSGCYSTLCILFLCLNIASVYLKMETYVIKKKNKQSKTEVTTYKQNEQCVVCVFVV